MERFISPDQIIKLFDLEKGDHVADFGAGHGYFAIPLAQTVGEKGKVYALDIQKNVLDTIRSKAKSEHLSNLEPIWADLEHPSGVPIPENFIDLVLISNTLFQTENKIGLLKEAYRLLRNKGKLAIIEWDNSATPLGPPVGMRIDKDKVKNVCEKLGFAFGREFPAGHHHYGLLFKKKQ